MRVLVTGGAGFIGSEFVRQCVERGFYVIVVDKLTYAGDLERLAEVEGKIRLYRVDIRDTNAIADIFSKEKPQVIVHFAAESHVDRSIFEPSVFMESNILGTLNLLNASKNHQVERFINISTDEVYGELGEEGFFSEETPLKFDFINLEHILFKKLNISDTHIFLSHLM